MAQSIWQKCIYDLGETDGVIYSIYDADTNNGSLIYQGKAYKEPGATNVLVDIAPICADYLHQSLPDSIESEVTKSAPIRNKFSVYVGSEKVGDTSLYLNYDYVNDDDMTDYSPHQPITGRLELGMILPLTIYKNSDVGSPVNYSKNGEAFTGMTYETTERTPGNTFFEPDSLGVYRIWLGGYNNLGAEYRVVSGCNRFALYYQNELGGIDVLVMEGRCKVSESYDRKEMTTTSGKQNYLNNITRSYELNTGWLTDAQSRLMPNIYGSTFVILWDRESGKFTKVCISDTENPVKTYRNDGMVSYTINVTESIERRRK